MLAARICISGIEVVERVTQFDDKVRGVDIRLVYGHRTAAFAGVKDGSLLELGYDDTVPNRSAAMPFGALDAAMARGAKKVSSWARTFLRAEAYLWGSTAEDVHEVLLVGRCQGFSDQLSAPL